VLSLVKSYQDKGHEASKLDPLELETKYHEYSNYKNARAFNVLSPE